MNAGKAHSTAAWAGVSVLLLATGVALIPPGFLVWLSASHNTGDSVTNHAQHLAAVRIAIFVIAFPGCGALIGWLGTLPARHPVSAVGRTAAMATGALLGSVVLTIGGAILVLSHATLTY
jgi:hypothetical protein